MLVEMESPAAKSFLSGLLAANAKLLNSESGVF
jgi:hypothetical protein